MSDSLATATQIHFVRLRILVPGVLGRVQFSSNSADVTALFWQASCDSRPATVMPGQEFCVGGEGGCWSCQRKWRRGLSRFTGGGGTGVREERCSTERWGIKGAATGRGVGKVFGFGASQAGPLACCIPEGQHNGVSFQFPCLLSPSDTLLYNIPLRTTNTHTIFLSHLACVIWMVVVLSYCPTFHGRLSVWSLNNILTHVYER